MKGFISVIHVNVSMFRLSSSISSDCLCLVSLVVLISLWLPCSLSLDRCTEVTLPMQTLPCTVIAAVTGWHRSLPSRRGEPGSVSLRYLHGMDMPGE